MAAEQAQGKVEASVFAIITAFTSGLDVFRKLRERRTRKKKTKKTHCSRSHSTAAQELLDDELYLAKSLQRGPVEIQDRYQLNRSHVGERFARGDSIAHASLTEVLLKLNTGLVAIISSFLCHGKNECNLDYRSLAHLSDCSRSEAIDALNQLSQRLSQSQVNLASRKPCCPNCQSPKHADCGSVVDLQSTREQKPTVAKKPSLVAVKQESNHGAAPPLPLSSSKTPKPKGSQSRLVMVRPRKSRLKPSSSASAIMQQSGSKPASTNATPPELSGPDAPQPPIRAAAAPPPPPKLHRLPKHKMLRSMTSLAAEPIPEHAMPSSNPLAASLPSPPPPYPGHLYPNRSSSTALRRTASSSIDNAQPPSTNAAPPPKPPKIPLTPQQRREQRNGGPTSTLLPYSPYPAATPPPPPPQQQLHSAKNYHRSRSHSRLRPSPPPRHSSMPPIPLLLLSEHDAHADQKAIIHQQHQNHQQTETQTPAQPPPPRRRTTVPVPASVYSFASDSTKLGEIPMARWAGGPWDAERAARLNAEAGWGEVGGMGVGVATVGTGKGVDAEEEGEARKKKGGRFGALWRWGSGGSAGSGGSGGSGSGSGSEREREKERDRARGRRVKA